jgi:xanthine dehydrogenase small subunit
MAACFGFLLNGRRVTVEDSWVDATLLEYLRASGLTGAKEGCAEGECGACAVAVVAEEGGYRVVNSCLMLLSMAAGQEIYTVEGLADGAELNPVQRVMVEYGGSQCGYCTPGFVMSLFAEYYRPGRSGACEIQALEGNLCRCTGYRPIRDAALALGMPGDDRFRRRALLPGPAREVVPIERCLELLEAGRIW